MTWEAFHRREDVLHAVIAEVDARRDGILPMGLPGVAETFGDEPTLLGALQLRWHTRLAGVIERELLDRPGDPEPAVVSAWRRTADELPGVRSVLDRYAEAPTCPATAQVLRAAGRKDRALLAAMSGSYGAQDRRPDAVGRDLEQRARAGYRPAASARHRRAPVPEAARPGSLLGRLRARLAA